MYCAYVTTIREIRKHGNADRLQCATVFGNNVIVNMDYHVGQKVVYFPTDGQLDAVFAEENGLLRRKDENGNQIGGYLDPEKRNIRALKLRGEQSDGLVLPVEVLAKYTDIASLSDGDQITVLNGHEICKKYIPNGGPGRRRPASSQQKKKQKKKSGPEKTYPFFEEHVDTAQLAYNETAFRPGDTCYITLKMHGTSGRTMNAVEVSNQKRGWFAKRVLKLPDKTTKTYSVVSGTRRRTLEQFEDGGFYGNDRFRQAYHDFFRERLPKGMEVFYEIVGYVNVATPVMGRCQNKLVKDKDFSARYGAVTTFSYGCEPGQNACYVYRMTMTNEDGVTVEIPWETVQILCEKMGVSCVPTFEKFLYTSWEDLMRRVETYYDGPDPVGRTHIREGVVVRIDNRPGFVAYKHKNFYFKCLEGIIKDASAAPDMEEAEESAEG